MNNKLDKSVLIQTNICFELPRKSKFIIIFFCCVPVVPNRTQQQREPHPLLSFCVFRLCCYRERVVCSPLAFSLELQYTVWTFFYTMVTHNVETTTVVLKRVLVIQYMMELLLLYTLCIYVPTERVCTGKIAIIKLYHMSMVRFTLSTIIYVVQQLLCIAVQHTN